MAENRETITCPHCGFQVERVSRDGNSTINIDTTTYSATCRRAKDLPAFDLSLAKSLFLFPHTKKGRGPELSSRVTVEGTDGASRLYPYRRSNRWEASPRR